MLAFVLAIRTITSPFVYVDPSGFVRLFGKPSVRSKVGQARQPDLAPDRQSFVYWTETDDTLREQNLRTGKERILVMGNVRSGRYAADGKTIFFSNDPKDSWDLYAVDRATGKSRIVLAEKSAGGSISAPRPQMDGTIVVIAGSQVLRIDQEGKVLWRTTVTPHDPDDDMDPDVMAPSPGSGNRFVGGWWTQDMDERLVGSDGTAGALWVYEASTFRCHRITPRTIHASNPCWTRDGKEVLYAGGPVNGRKGIWSIQPNGMETHFLIRGDEPSAGVPEAQRSK